VIEKWTPENTRYWFVQGLWKVLYQEIISFNTRGQQYDFPPENSLPEKQVMKT
jgi:hypothetical protein